MSPTCIKRTARGRKGVVNMISRERVLEIGGAEVSRKGWTVAVAYWTQANGVRWGTFSHTQKAKAHAVWRNLENSAHAIRLYRAGVEVARREPQRETIMLDG